MNGLVKAGLNVGKELLANTVADKLGNKESTSTETPSTKLDIDESPTIDMSDNYESTSYDSNEDDPGFVDIDIPDAEQLELENPDVVDIPNDIPDVAPIDKVELPGEQEVIEDETIPVDIEPTQASSGDLNTDTSAPLTGNTTNGSFNAGIPIGSSFMPSIEGANSPVELPQIQQPNANNIPSTDIDTTVSSDPNELVQAMYEGDPVKTEEYIEQNPEESIDILKDGTAIDTEARQVIDGNPRNVEVKDEAVEEALKDPGSFINSDKIGLLSSEDEFNEVYNTLEDIVHQSPNESKEIPETKIVDHIEQTIGKEIPEDIKADVEKEAKFISSIDWDKVNVYKPEEDHSEWDNVPDFDTSDWTAEMGENPLPEGERPNFHRDDAAIDRMQDRLDRDEDFAGPDELPATYEQIVEPGKELALTNGNQLAPIENAEDAGFSWEIIDSQIDNDVDEDETIPEEEKEETKERRHRIISWLNEVTTATGHGSTIANTEPTTDNALLRTGFGPSVGIGNLMRASGNVSGGHMGKVGYDELHSRKPAAMGTTPNVTGVVENNFGTATKMKSNVNAPKSSTVTRTNGALSTSSGGLMSTRKKSGEFKSDKIKLASGESRSNKKAITPEDLNDADILVNRLKMMLSKMSPLVRKQLGFNPVSYQYKGTAIDKLPPEVVNKLIRVIEENGLAQ